MIAVVNGRKDSPRNGVNKPFLGLVYITPKAHYDFNHTLFILCIVLIQKFLVRLMYQERKERKGFLL
jgi:hypothetical protein